MARDDLWAPPPDGRAVPATLAPAEEAAHRADVVLSFRDLVLAVPRLLAAAAWVRRRRR